MKSRTEILLKTLNVLSWIACIGLAIIAGSIIISFIVSLGHPQASKDLYKGLDLSAYREISFVQYAFVVFYKVVFYSLQAFIAFLMTVLLSRLNITRPFSTEVVKVMHRISFAILGVWGIAMIHNIHIAILEKTLEVPANYISGDSIFLAGIVYVIAQVFNRGVEIQSENELTV